MGALAKKKGFENTNLIRESKAKTLGRGPRTIGERIGSVDESSTNGETEPSGGWSRALKGASEPVVAEDSGLDPKTPKLLLSFRGGIKGNM